MSVAISSASMAVSSAALAQANAAETAAEKTACALTMKNFSDQNASDAQKLEYAKCVRLVVPEPYQPPTSGEKLVVGGLVSFFLVCVVLNILYVRKRTPWGMEAGDYAMGVMGGVLVASGVSLLGWGSWALFKFLTA